MRGSVQITSPQLCAETKNQSRSKSSDTLNRCDFQRERNGGSVNAFLAVVLTRVMRVTVPIPAVVTASVLHSDVVGGSVVGDVGTL